MKIATIRLQWNPKAKMMRAVRILTANFLTAVEAAASCDDKRIYSNDQHVEACDEACAVAFGRRDTRNRSTRVGAGAEPGATRRHQIPVPLRLYGALLQRAAGRRGLAAMPAEEHVEPVIELPERGARGGSAGGGAKPAETAAPKAAAPAAATTAAPKAAEPKAAARPPRDSQPARRSPPSAAHVAPIIRRSARACRPAARRPCNAWKRTRRSSRPVARRPSPPPAAVERQRRTAAGAAPAAAGAAAAAPATPTVIVLRPMRPREELFVLRSACGADVRSICGGVRARRRPDRAMSRHQCRPAFAGLQGRAVPVRGAIDRALAAILRLIRGSPVTRHRERRG